jgi:hypothetical protein
MQAKLSEVHKELRRRMHEPIPEVGEWLRSVVAGHIRYYGVPMNSPALNVFRFQVGRLWMRVLSRRSQKAEWTGSGCGDSSLVGCLPLFLVIRTLCVVLALLPEARAGCGKPARPDPWRGS